MTTLDENLELSRKIQLKYPEAVLGGSTVLLALKVIKDRPIGDLDIAIPFNSKLLNSVGAECLFATPYAGEGGQAYNVYEFYSGDIKVNIFKYFEGKFPDNSEILDSKKLGKCFSPRLILFYKNKFNRTKDIEDLDLTEVLKSEYFFA